MKRDLILLDSFSTNWKKWAKYFSGGPQWDLQFDGGEAGANPLGLVLVQISASTVHMSEVFLGE